MAALLCKLSCMPVLFLRVLAGVNVPENYSGVLDHKCWLNYLHNVRTNIEECNLLSFFVCL